MLCEWADRVSLLRCTGNLCIKGKRKAWSEFSRGGRIPRGSSRPNISMVFLAQEAKFFETLDVDGCDHTLESSLFNLFSSISYTFFLPKWKFHKMNTVNGSPRSKPKRLPAGRWE